MAIYDTPEQAIQAVKDLRNDYLSTIGREDQNINGQGFWYSPKRSSRVSDGVTVSIPERILEPATK